LRFRRRIVLVDTLRNAATSATFINGETGLERSGGPERSAARICPSCGPSSQFAQARIPPLQDVSSVFDRHGLAMSGSITHCKASTDPKLPDVFGRLLACGTAKEGSAARSKRPNSSAIKVIAGGRNQRYLPIFASWVPRALEGMNGQLGPPG
jgi:hypothetical protein